MSRSGIKKHRLDGCQMAFPLQVNAVENQALTNENCCNLAWTHVEMKTPYLSVKLKSTRSSIPLVWVKAFHATAVWTSTIYEPGVQIKYMTHFATIESFSIHYHTGPNTTHLYMTLFVWWGGVDYSKCIFPDTK